VTLETVKALKNRVCEFPGAHNHTEGDVPALLTKHITLAFYVLHT